MAVQFDQGRFETQVGKPVEVRVAEQERLSREQQALGPPPTVYVPEERVDTRAGLGELAYAALRVTVGTVLLAHGLLKLQDMTAWVAQVRALGMPAPATMALLSVVAELGGGIALILGLFTRLAALMIAINMLVGIIVVHAGHGLFAKNGGFEYPLIVMMTAVLFLAEGSRRFGVDARFWQAVHRRRDHGRTRPPMRPRYATH